MTTKDNLKVSNSNTAKKIMRLFAPLVWAVAILWLSLTSSPPQLPGILGWDKLLHAGAYALLTLLIAQYLLSLSLSPGKICLYAGLAAVCFGALLEVMQFLMQTGRTAEWWDLFADAVGVFLACVIFRQIVFVVCQYHEHQGKKHG